MDLFKTIANHILDGIVVHDHATTITYANPAFVAMSGFDTHSLVGTPIGTLLPSMYSNKATEAVEHDLSTEHWTRTVEIQRPDQSLWMAHVTCAAVADPETSQQFWVMTFRDITAHYQIEQRLQVFEQIVEDAIDGIAMTSFTDQFIVYSNSAFAEICGYEPDEIVGTSIVQYLGDPEGEFLIVQNHIIAQGRWKGVVSMRRKDGSLFPAMLSLFNTMGAEGSPDKTVGIARDISAQQESEQERIRLQQRVIDAQQELLHELSTPVIPIADGLLILPLIGAIDVRRAGDIMERLLENIAAQHAHTVVIDITGVALVDTTVANALVHMARAAQLLGARVMLTGIQPEVAQTLIGLGTDFGGLQTYSTLQRGVTAALR